MLITGYGLYWVCFVVVFPFLKGITSTLAFFHGNNEHSAGKGDAMFSCANVCWYINRSILASFPEYPMALSLLGTILWAVLSLSYISNLRQYRISPGLPARLHSCSHHHKSSLDDACTTALLGPPIKIQPRMTPSAADNAAASFLCDLPINM